MGVAYDAPRLRASTLTIVGGGTAPVAQVLHGQPGLAQEWRLVSVSGRVDSVHKLGDRWRAEIVVGAQSVVVVGEAGAGIPSTALEEGRTATVIGIARRPFPSATDRRFAVTPRFAADVRVDGRPGSAAAVTGTVGTAAQTDVAGTGPIATPSGSAAPAADLVDLDGLVGATVRVGGLVVDLRPDGFTLDDGTATGRVVLRGAALELLPLIEPDDALEATGHVESSPDGAVLVVDDPAGIVQASDPLAAAPSAPPAAAPLAVGAGSSGPPSATSRFAGLGVGPFGFDPGAAGLGTLLVVSALSVAVTVLRRERVRRRMAARIAGRLATFAGQSAGPSTDPPGTLPGTPPAVPLATPPAERAPSTIHSA
jgi:hypothetical protein